MFVHAVYFWLRDDLTGAEMMEFVEGVSSLRAIDSVKHGWVGVPAATDRPVIERSYSHALILVFADRGAHDAYQVHPVHDRFRQNCSTFWRKVVIYDSEADGG